MSYNPTLPFLKRGSWLIHKSQTDSFSECDLHQALPIYFFKPLPLLGVVHSLLDQGEPSLLGTSPPCSSSMIQHVLSWYTGKASGCLITSSGWLLLKGTPFDIFYCQTNAFVTGILCKWAQSQGVVLRRMYMLHSIIGVELQRVSDSS